jgi:hypothetical protein
MRLRDHESVRELLEDVEFYRALGPAERARLLAEVCQVAAALLRPRPDAERAAAHVDPYPASTSAALARLRALRKSRRSQGGSESSGPAR